jgi:hypothetical protein
MLAMFTLLLLEYHGKEKEINLEERGRSEMCVLE